MRLELAPIAAETDPAALAERLVPSFGGDEAAARDIIVQTLDFLTRVPRPEPWGSYLATSDDVPVAIGAFKAAPDDTGIVEIAYMTFPKYEGRGHASATIASLYRLACAAEARVIVAHTLPEENASNRALRRNGFAFAGETIDPEDGLVWRWERLCGA
jgi:RimJ/RimL family protein N-acetyltransferase